MATDASAPAKAARYFMQLAYCGRPYHGWQVQPGQSTVQGEIERALSTVLRTPTSLTGAGRTDTGVNARMMIAHFDSATPLPPNLCRSLNAMLGPDIAIQKVWQVADDAHARFDATERTYRYFVTTEKDPFLCHFALQVPPATDFAAMNSAAERLLGERDFTSFSKLHTQVKTNICQLRACRWHQSDSDPRLWYLEITADRFLRNMVRAVAGTLLDVGRGKLAAADIDRILALKDRCAASTSLPPHPLFLWQIKYPEV